MHKTENYSISSLAWMTSDCGMVGPSALAVVRLMTAQIWWAAEWVDPQVWPSENAPSVGANLSIQIREADSVAYQPACFGKFAGMIHRGHRVASCQGDNLIPTRIEEWTTCDRERTEALLAYRCKGRIDLAIGIGAQNASLEAGCMASFLCLFQLTLGFRKFSGNPCSP